MHNNYCLKSGRENFILASFQKKIQYSKLNAL